ncbi:MAG TPA: zinc-binding dehydrogenase [bacterium]|nr:zinc-binding dehydrogenase [bacterium]
MTAGRVRAATLVAAGRYELREYPAPDPAPGCVLVRMELSGICGTDKHTYQGYTTQYAGTATPREIPFPIIQGHENVGTVAAIGGDGRYEDFEGTPLCVGDRVVVGANVVCGRCYYCRHDFPYYFCERMVDYGNNMTAATPPHLFGGWSQFLYVVPGSFLVRVPDELPSEIAVLTEVMAVTVGLDRAKQFSAVPNESFLFDDTVVVLGVGPLGMCHVIKARMLGAGTLIAVDLSAHRLDMAKRLGADYVVNAAQTTAAQRLGFVRDLTHGRGPDVVIECAGVPQVIPEALEMLRVGGMLVEAGNFSDLGDVAISPHRHLCSKNVRIIGVGGEEAAAYGPSMRQMARYMQHHPLREFVSHRYRLEDVEAAVLKSIAPDSMKVVIDPWA